MFLALKELAHGKLRFSMIATIIVLISWLVFILSGLGNGLATLTAGAFQTMQAEYVVYEEGSRASMNRSVLSEDLVAQLEEQPNVRAAAPMGSALRNVSKIESVEAEKVDVALLGILPGSFLEPNIIEGKALDSNEPMHVIANQTLKEDGFMIGDLLRIEGSTEEMEIVGFVENQTYNHIPAIFVTIDKWRTIQFAAPGSDRGIEAPVNAIMLQGEAIDPEQLKLAFSETQTVTKAEAIKGIPGYSEQNGTIMLMLAFLLAISAFVLAVFFYVLTLQKTNQFGIMKAMGASNSFLGKAIVSQVFLLSLGSILIGILLTIGTALVLPDGMPFDLDPTLVITYGIVLLVLSVLSSLLSVRKITKIDPLKAIGRVE
ncbi:ABC transporter permease [Anaerobacillus isosaccharinicus]|uniref:Putative hemin transport system permease protein HrtB n=1 Tax=Anaerobacillus isosaccharinicus TaxID=1532552 RepID=A0A1S2MDS6_9BACI|nr:ABC transporter permease [Anaerobacillus isosaccharinicus]MBA5586526.1 ABC transporter permease [Anaerobacillus isosaccharinicus]QOY35233.1 ABC transporter permease [Anaerobacillus isosaccharinicus]